MVARSTGAHRAARLGRKHGLRPLLPRILVVCEGKTEQKLLEALRGHWHIPSVSVLVVGQAGVPATVVKRAKDERKGFDEVWVVFDRDEHPSWAGAIEEANANKFALGVSNPCVELWGLLLHVNQTAHIDRFKAQQMLSQQHPNYHHDKNPYFDVATVLKHIEVARARAEALLNLFETQEDRYRCPTTRMHHLLARIAALQLPDGKA
jgi:hypothetical protein